MNLSIVIASYNTKELLDRCLESIYSSLKHSKLSFKVIVVDNCSSDGSIELIEKNYKKVELIKNKENIGFGRANNLAIKKSEGEYILLLNSDCVVLENAIENLYYFALEKNGFIGGKLFNEDNTSQQSCGPFYNLFVIMIMLFLKGDQLGITRYSPNKSRIVDWVSGACLIGRKSDFISVGLFDESIFMYMEEIDLLYRAKKRGINTWFYPNAHFIHIGAASSGDKRDPVVQIYKGLIYFYKKHKSNIEIIILKLILRIKAWFVVLVCGIIGKQGIKVLYAKALAAIT